MLLQALDHAAGVRDHLHAAPGDFGKGAELPGGAPAFAFQAHAAQRRLRIAGIQKFVAQRFDLDDTGLTTTMKVTAAERAFPVSFGWHPWFRKPASLEFAPLAMYRRDAIGLPTGELVVPSDGPWDDCFVAGGPIGLVYDRERASHVTVDSDCDHWVVYDHPLHATCVEPQSGPPDSVTIRPRVVLLVALASALAFGAGCGWKTSS